MKKQLSMMIMLALFFLIYPDIEVTAKEYNTSVNGGFVTVTLSPAINTNAYSKNQNINKRITSLSKLEKAISIKYY